MTLTLVTALLLIQADKAALAEEAAKALKATAAKGFEAAGEGSFKADKDHEDYAEWLGGDSATLTAAVQGSFEAVVTVKAKKATYEVFHKGARTVERLTWRGSPVDSSDSANDILSLLDLAKLAGAAAKAIAAKAAGDETLGEVKCRKIRVTLDGTAIGSYLERDPDDEADPGYRVETVEVTLWIDADGLVRKLDGAVTKIFDDGEGDEVKLVDTWTFTFAKFGATKVEFPPELKKALSD